MRIHITEITMNHSVNKLASIFKEMVKNRQTMGCQWKNIALGKEAFGIMKQLPDTLPGEYDSPEKKAELLSQMLDQMEETESARFCIEVREYIASLSPQDEHNFAELQKLRDYTDPSMPMEEYCKRYRRLLKFDPVERTAEYEAVLPEVEAEVSKELKGAPRGMGFCFGYWAAKRSALAERGIEWHSPAAMNPCVMFD